MITVKRTRKFGSVSFQEVGKLGQQCFGVLFARKEDPMLPLLKAFNKEVYIQEGTSVFHLFVFHHFSFSSKCHLCMLHLLK